jgi:uncharacterized protein (DUF2141 family)
LKTFLLFLRYFIVMKKFFIILFFTFFLLSATSSAGQETFSLEIEIENVRSEKGKIFFQLLDANQKVLKEIVADIENHRCKILLSGLKPGDYAFRYFHDENNNQKMDRNILGVPREGFGFSNDPANLIGEPSFDKWIFQINGHTSKTTVIKYF